MDKLAVIVTATCWLAGREDICRVDVAAVPPHRQCADLVELAGEYSESLAWAVAAQFAGYRGLPVAGPKGIHWPDGRPGDGSTWQGSCSEY
jgi:hypothetical protein